MILHTLNAAPSSPAFAQCLELAAAQDCILLLGDGVYAALPGSEASERLGSQPARICVLEADAAAAGLLPRLGAVEVLDYEGFVTLSEQYPRQMAWY